VERGGDSRKGDVERVKLMGRNSVETGEQERVRISGSRKHAGTGEGCECRRRRDIPSWMKV
jgi:hypothetical protein